MAVAQVAVAAMLSIEGVDFLLSDDLAGAGVFPSLVAAVEALVGRGRGSGVTTSCLCCHLF